MYDWNDIENGPAPLCMKCGKQKNLYGPDTHRMCLDCLSTILEAPHIEVPDGMEDTWMDPNRRR